MNQSDYSETVQLTESLLERVAGWVPRCLPCWVREQWYNGITRHYDWEPMNVRYVSVSGHTSDATVPQHADVTLKCPQCRYHQHHGLPLTDDELSDYERLLGENMKFDAATDWPDRDTRDDHLRDLGYLE